MPAKLNAILMLFMFPLTAFSQEMKIKLSGFECANNYTAALEWLGLNDGYPRNVVEDLQEELVKFQAEANIYEIKCKSEPFYVSRPYFNGNKIIAGKTQEVSISFSFSMAATIPPNRDRTLHIDMTYTGDNKSGGDTININRHFSIVGHVNNKI